MEQCTLNEFDFKTPKGFEQLYNANFKDLYLICFAQLKDHNACQEIVHDLFRSVWERRDTLDISVPIAHYLRRATKLRVLDHIRSEDRKLRHINHLTREYAMVENNTEDLVYLNELQDRISELIQQLPERCRKVFRLSREKGLSITEIASLMLISENTVKVHLTRALGVLRRNLSEYTQA